MGKLVPKRDEAMEFKDKLRKLRTESGLTQEALADSVHISRSAIAKYENGNGQPSEDTLEALAFYFGVDKSALESDGLIAKRKKRKRIIVGSIVGGAVLLLGLVIGGFAIYMASGEATRTGVLTTFRADPIGNQAVKEEKTITIEGHSFAYFNVKSDFDGSWVFMGTDSYVINEDIQFGFRFANASHFNIESYNGSQAPTFRGMSEIYYGYTDYQVFKGFKITVKDASVPEYRGLRAGVFMHWC